MTWLAVLYVLGVLLIALTTHVGRESVALKRRDESRAMFEGIRTLYPVTLSHSTRAGGWSVSAVIESWS